MRRHGMTDIPGHETVRVGTLIHSTILHNAKTGTIHAKQMFLYGQRTRTSAPVRLPDKNEWTIKHVPAAIEISPPALVSAARILPAVG